MRKHKGKDNEHAGVWNTIFRFSKRKETHGQRIGTSHRFMVAAEYEAVQLYMQLAESTDNELAVAVLKDIADEERVHAGEFLRLLRELRNFYLIIKMLSENLYFQLCCKSST